jgi:hypothetical protein
MQLIKFPPIGGKHLLKSVHEIFRLTNFCYQSVIFFSVLAAASPVFATMFRENPIVEEDVRISVVGYSYTSLRSIIEYIYTGSLEFFERDKVIKFSR